MLRSVALCTAAVSFFVSAVLAGPNSAQAADLPTSPPVSSVPTATVPSTLTNDWFGNGAAMRAAGFDLRLEWSQFYQGMTQGRGDREWQYGGKFDALTKVDLSKFGFWQGFSVTTQHYYNYGHSVNGLGGSLFPENAALYFPGITGSDRYDVMALFVQQDFGNLASLLIGKLNLIEATRGTPLRGGGGADTFWNVNIATPITGLSPPTINGAQLRINTQPVSYSLTVFDAQDASNKPLFSNLFEQGVNVMGTATYKTSINGLTGYYGVKGIYSTKEGPDFSQLVPSIINRTLITKRGSWFTSFSMQQYLIQDPTNPRRGWGFFGEIGKSDGNPNTLDWSTYVGFGGSSLLAARPDDKFGVAYFRYGVSEPLKNTLAPVFNLQDQSGVEVFYNVAVTPWFRVTADIQFIRPASGSFPDSVYAGLGTSIKF